MRELSTPQAQRLAIEQPDKWLSILAEAALARFAGVWRAVRLRREMAALKGLSDQRLADLGLARDEIARAVRSGRRAGPVEGPDRPAASPGRTLVLIFNLGTMPGMLTD